MTKLGVGATSRRVIEVAAELQVHQIVASRRQVDVGGGYTGLDQERLVELVRDLSDGKTKVVRDHGGPLEEHEAPEVYTASFDADVAAGFDALHIDVCQLPQTAQKSTLRDLYRMYKSKIRIEVGGEHDSISWNHGLFDVVTEDEEPWPGCIVLSVGTHVWADRQIGRPINVDEAKRLARNYHRFGIQTKMHNADWLYNRHRYGDAVDVINVAPEFAKVEVDALLTVLPFENAAQLLTYAYDSKAWRRWFHPDEGTWDERARCAVRYVLNHDGIQSIVRLSQTEEIFVRERIRDAILAG